MLSTVNCTMYDVHAKCVQWYSFWLCRSARCYFVVAAVVFALLIVVEMCLRASSSFICKSKDWRAYPNYIVYAYVYVDEMQYRANGLLNCANKQPYKLAVLFLRASVSLCATVFFFVNRPNRLYVNPCYFRHIHHHQRKNKTNTYSQDRRRRHETKRK